MSRPIPMLPLIYIAGPYRAKTREGVALNIESARATAVEVARRGWFPAIPHTMTGGLELVLPELDDAYWLEGTMELMRRCDAVVLCPGWERSRGTAAEIAEAERLGIPIYKTTADIPNGRGSL